MTDKNWKEVAQAFLDSKKEVVESVALEVNEDGTPAANTIKTKSTALSGIIQTISSMSHEEMMKWLTDAVQMTGLSTAAKNAATLKMKPSSAGVQIPEEAKAIFGDDLNEEQVKKVSVLIENIIDTRFAVERVALEEAFVEMFAEAMEAEVAALAEQVDTYVTYAAEQWVEKNEVAIESAIKVERAERLIEGLKSLFAETNVEIAEEQVSAVDELTAKVEELTSKLNETLEESIQLHETIEELEAQDVFREVSEGLALTEVEKLKTLVEDVEIGGDRDELKKKLEIIRDAHFKKESKTPAKTGLNEQVEGDEPAGDAPNVKVDPRMARLSDAISRASTNRYVPSKS